MALGTSHRGPGRLPPQATGFVGRQVEIERMCALLKEARLVTVTGTGGVGKTRLALRAAAQAADRYPDGVHLVELSPLRDPKLLGYTVAARLGLPGEDERPQLEVVLDYLRGREPLLILDTCEHLIDACATFADAVLRAAPRVTILATSRQPLDIAGENTFLLSPLPVPEPDGLASDADAVELFAQRAAAVVDGFTVTAENRADVCQVCRTLDGIPLAIELATVRLRAVPLDQMAKRLDDRLRVLTGGKRGGLPRHQTLQAAAEWSYELCTPPEQLLWARLSVFAGSFDLAAAEEVCAGAELSRDEIIETLVGLVDKSVLVRYAESDSEPAQAEPSQAELAQADGPSGARYRMLDTLREFGAERLADGNTEAIVRSRFVAHYLAMAERFGNDPTRDQFSQYSALRREHVNLRAAFDYALDLPGNDSAAISIATSLNAYWTISGQLREGRYWLDRVLERCARPSPARARVLSARGYVASILGDLHNARDDAEASIALAARFGDATVCGRSYLVLNRAFTHSGDFAEAEEMAAAAASCFASVGDAIGLALLDVQTCMLHLHAGSPDACIERATEGLRRLPADELLGTSYLLGAAGMGLLLRGEFDRSGATLRRSLAMKHQLGDVAGTAHHFGALSFVAAGQRRYERAAWLIGASAPLWERVGRWYMGIPALVALHKMTERAAQDGLGEERYWQLRALGSATPLDQVVTQAVADADQLTAELLPAAADPGRDPWKIKFKII